MTRPETQIAKLLRKEERSQAWLARKLRVSRQTICLWVARKERVPVARQAQIAVTFGVKADDYFGRDGYAR